MCLIWWQWQQGGTNMLKAIGPTWCREPLSPLENHSHFPVQAKPLAGPLARWLGLRLLRLQTVGAPSLNTALVNSCRLRQVRTHTNALLRQEHTYRVHVCLQVTWAATFSSSLHSAGRLILHFSVTVRKQRVASHSSSGLSRSKYPGTEVMVECWFSAEVMNIWQNAIGVQYQEGRCNKAGDVVVFLVCTVSCMVQTMTPNPGKKRKKSRLIIHHGTIAVIPDITLHPLHEMLWSKYTLELNASAGLHIIRSPLTELSNQPPDEKLKNLVRAGKSNTQQWSREQAPVITVTQKHYGSSLTSPCDTAAHCIYYFDHLCTRIKKWK